MHSRSAFPPSSRRVWPALAVVLMLLQACNLPVPAIGRGRATPTSLPGKAQTQVIENVPVTPAGDLPPALVEADPIPNSRLGLEDAVTLYFNQAMERQSVEAALKLEGGGSPGLRWVDDATLQVDPGQALSPGSRLALTVAASARAKNGQALVEPVALSYQAADLLRVRDRLPGSGAAEIDPRAAVAVTFNQPVVPLGDTRDSPAGFTLEPPAQGEGRWLNTSTYLFTAEPALQGGVRYAVRINPDRVSTSGTGLEQAPGDWYFTTAVPRLLQASPRPDEPVGLDQEFTLTFNQSMDPDRTEAAVGLFDPAGVSVALDYEWNDEHTLLTLKPAELLARNTSYSLGLSPAGAGMAGTPVEQPYEALYQTIPDFGVEDLAALQAGGVKPYTQRDFTLKFTSALDPDQDFASLVTFEPALALHSAIRSWSSVEMFVSAPFESDVRYTIVLSADLRDRWGQTLGRTVRIPLRPFVPAPSLMLPALQSYAIFLTPEDAAIPTVATGIQELNLASRPAELREYLDYFDDYSIPTMTSPADRWQVRYQQPTAVNTTVGMPVSPDGQPLDPGLYLLEWQSPQMPAEYQRSAFFVAVSRIHLTLKIGFGEALVWAVNLEDHALAAGLPVLLMDKNGRELGSAQTDRQGLARISLPEVMQPSDPLIAVSGQPGDENYAFSVSEWNNGLMSWDFYLPGGYWRNPERLYMYTDRPIYRPGQTVYYRMVGMRPTAEGWVPMQGETVPLKLVGAYSPEMDLTSLMLDTELALSEFGTAEGYITLPDDAPAGSYSFTSGDEYSLWSHFDVASYRKPEVDLKIDFDQGEYRRGEDIQGSISAGYFFGAPTGQANVSWRLHARSYNLRLPEGYSSGRVTFGYNFSYFDQFPGPGAVIASGDGLTGEDGRLVWQVDGASILDQLPDSDLLTLTLEATVFDASGMPVSRREQAVMVSGDTVIGLRAERWGAVEDEEIGFEVRSFDLQARPSSDKALRAEFSQVVWQQGWFDYFWGESDLSVEKTLVASTDFVTGREGEARIAFTPPAPGTYLLIVSGEGATSELLIWVRGQSEVRWPELPDQQIEIDLDRESYLPGDTASAMIPIPFPGTTLALVTVERNQLLQTRVLEIYDPALTMEFPLADAYAPNVYISAILIGRGEQGKSEYRMGLKSVAVEPVEQRLHVNLTSDPQQAGPGETVTFHVDARDPAGQPAQAELSLAVVDKAVLALKEPNAATILEAFYGRQSLGVKTAMPLSAYALRAVSPEMGVGGAGGGDGSEVVQMDLRRNFEDTALWAGALRTDENGQASIAVQLPDNLTTWVAQARGLTTGALVGEASIEVVASKPLLIRPVTPRFLVEGDHLRLGGIVHNNTGAARAVETSLQADGFVLDSGQNAVQTVEVPAGGSQAVYWWGTASSVEQVELAFSAQSGEYSDAATPALGSLPVLRYTAPQAFGTAGVLAEAGRRLEVVSLPRSFDPSGGRLWVEVSPSLAATILSDLEAIQVEPRDWTETVISSLLPNAAAQQMLQNLNIQDEQLRGSLAGQVSSSAQWLSSHQNSDGGWGFSTAGKSDPHLTAYGLLALTHARKAGADVPESAISYAQNYLQATLIEPRMSTEDWLLDRLAFEHYALALSGLQVPHEALLNYQERMSPWARALLAAALLDVNAQSGQARDILADLQATASRTATGVFWPAGEGSSYMVARPVPATAMIVMVLAEYDPASSLLADAVRYLAANRRRGGWGSTYETAWVLLAFQRYLQGTGELNANFDYSVRLNGQLMAGGYARDEVTLEPAVGQAPISALDADQPSGLEFLRGEGAGRLYYRAYLEVTRPAATVAPLAQGVTVERSYLPSGQNCLRDECQPLAEFSLSHNRTVLVQLAITVPEDQYNLVVEDVIPAGSEIADASLLTTAAPADEERYDPLDPFGSGYGRWYFSTPRYRDDRVRWVADYLPAGSYTLTYRLMPVLPGDYQVLPARAWAYYFPETQGHSAGQLVSIVE